MRDVLVKFGDVQQFVASHEDISPATQAKLMSILSDAKKRGLLLLELLMQVNSW